jgi:isoquinoline 1-oxidoreductase beta subunit
MGAPIQLTRREFFKVSAVAGGSLLLEFHLGPRLARADAAGGAFAPNAWLRIERDGTVTVQVGSSEMGQGVMTAIPMMLAEELDADWSKVRSVAAPADKAFTNPRIGSQLTGGSTAVRGYWEIARKAGATARDLLVSAAAQDWGVKPESCRTENGAVIHKGDGRRLAYGELADKAARLPVPEAVLLKEPDEFRLIGRPLPRLDTPAKVDGSAVFGMDVRVPGMPIAVVARCPVFGGKLRRFDATAAKRIKGVHEVIAISRGVAVVADDFWSARRGRDALELEWDEGPGAKLTSAAIRKEFENMLDNGASVRSDGDVDDALTRAPRKLSAVYEVPYLAHACMEPMNATAHVRADGCDIWVGTQAQTFAQRTAALITGLSSEQVKIHTMFLGGGFGRRSEQDFVIEAVELSKATGKPVKVVWTREDDMQHDAYRPATYNALEAALDQDGRPVAWRHRIAGSSIMARAMPQFAPAVAPEWLPKGVRKAAATVAGIVAEFRLDNTSVEGAKNLPYDIPNLEVRYAMVNTTVPVGFWRSVGSSQNAFITECFLDELARAAGQDPYRYRRRLLAKHPRHRNVLDLAARMAQWDKPAPAGRHRGIAVAESFGSYCAQVAEVSIERGRVRVHRVVCAIDCGMYVNPSIIAAQMESGIVYGLTAALKGEITIDKGRVVQGNFNDYPLLTIGEMPEIEVHIVKNAEPPGGVGEPGTPPIAPAVANAVFAATGRPVRRLPIRL